MDFLKEIIIEQKLSPGIFCLFQRFLGLFMSQNRKIPQSRKNDK